MKPTNSPTPGQPNPRKNRLKVAFGPLFPTANTLSWVGIDFYVGNRLQEIQPNQILRKHPVNIRVQMGITLAARVVYNAIRGAYPLLYVVGCLRRSWFG